MHGISIGRATGMSQLQKRAVIANDTPASLLSPPLASVAAQAAAIGLGVRGAFHPSGDEARLLADLAAPTGTCVLLGFTGSVQWLHFASSEEANDGLPDPLDRWSRRLIGTLAREFGAHELYPSGEPRVPFQRLAAQAESVHSSPIGLLIHPEWGLWHAYRGALLFQARLALPARQDAASPCFTCSGQPCLTACPVDAFGASGFALRACVAHVTSVAGTECRERGCRARRACPVGAEFRYPADQMRFHMNAFIRSVGK